ncbi:MAG: hypothetical protein ABJO52_20845 [Nisaea sp.]|uniref:hypothetical protein n=1 Tax=Nisaea sp. TaxID=2024842 RepID=UPI0032989528
MPKTPDHRTTIRFKPDEYALVTAKAGRKPVSTYLRELALEKAVQERKAYMPAPAKDHKVLAQILALLGQHKLVKEFKKAERNIHDGLQPADDVTKLLLVEIRDLLSKIHNLLIRALGGSSQ